MAQHTPSDNDDDEIKKLIAIAQNKTEVKYIDETPFDEVQRFVISKGIKEGSYKVLPYLLFHMYQRWTKKPMAARLFYREMKRLFKPKRISHTNFYYLNPEPFDPSLKTYTDIRIRQREEREMRKKAYAERKANWERKKSQKRG